MFNISPSCNVTKYACKEVDWKELPGRSCCATCSTRSGSSCVFSRYVLSGKQTLKWLSTKFQVPIHHCTVQCANALHVFVLHFCKFYTCLLVILAIHNTYILSYTVQIQTVYWSLDFRLYHVKTILHCHWLKFWWRNRFLVNN